MSGASSSRRAVRALPRTLSVIGTDSEDKGIWRWRDGRVFFDVAADAGAPRTYAPWEEGQPNDLNGEDCMRSSGGVWRDLDCSRRSRSCVRPEWDAQPS